MIPSVWLPVLSLLFRQMPAVSAITFYSIIFRTALPEKNEQKPKKRKKRPKDFRPANAFFPFIFHSVLHFFFLLPGAWDASVHNDSEIPAKLFSDISFPFPFLPASGMPAPDSRQAPHRRSLPAFFLQPAGKTPSDKARLLPAVG